MIVVLPAEGIRNWDQYTMQHEPVSSLALMERAALCCAEWLHAHQSHEAPVALFCGTGNNGGDGLAMARYLLEWAYHVLVYTPSEGKRSTDNLQQLQKLKDLYSPCIHAMDGEWNIPPNAIVVDALFGNGLQRTLQGEEKNWVEKINQLPNTKISIDLPSGLSADQYFPESTAVKATHTLTFQCYKKTLLFPETGAHAGLVTVLDIGLHPDFLSHHGVTEHIIDRDLAQRMYQPRALFSHKGTFGHALLFTGSRGKMGASVLAAKACLRSGAGLLSMLTPEEENLIVQTAVPEAMTLPLEENSLLPRLDPYQAIAAGCGLGQGEKTNERLIQLLSESSIPLILDADALNLIAQQPDLLKIIPKGSLLTPHPKEFDRLFGPHASTFERFETQRRQATELKLYILLKGHHTALCTPLGESYFTITGNPGMAKGGSGDVLTGILCGLQAQYRDIWKTAVLGAYLHGLSGDIAAGRQSQESMIASDIIESLGLAFQSLSDKVGR